MPTPIRMPDFGTAVTEIRILKWLIEEGQAVTRGTLLAELETDKAVTELECVAVGVLLQQCAPAGAMVEAGQIIAYVGAPGEKLVEEPPRVSPVVKNLAAKMGVVLAAIQGTGDGGMITREDVLRAARTAPTAAPTATPTADPQAAVARAVSQSHAEIPHLRIVASIDMSAARKLRAEGISYDAMFLRAMALAAQAVPLSAAPRGIHIALAVSSGDDLRLPVVRDVDQKDLAAVESEVQAVAARARDGALRLEEMTGGSMALSNLGMYPIDTFDAIIYPGQCAILALGAVENRVVAIEGRVEIRPMVTVTLAADHRTVNGRAAAEYLTALKRTMETGRFE